MSRTLPASVFIIALIIIIFPTLLARSCRPEEIEQPPAVDRRPIESPAGEIMLSVYRHDLNKIVEMSLEEYLVGVVAAEMPASFELEALKAQAVGARTYAFNQIRALGGRGCDKHPGADICTDSTHCQAWESEEQSLAKWPAREGPALMNKLRAAVRETAGEIVTYNGRPIDAVFHSHCGGHTENSEDVWSAALPYLRAVPCPFCDGTRWSRTKHEFTGAEFARAILPYVSAVPVSSSGRPLLDAPSRTAGGRIRTLRVAGEAVAGRDFRSALKLPSTNFSWEFKGDKVIFTAKGHGHGVGLCQYGADGLAKQGKTHDYILRYFYSGVKLGSISRQ